MDSNMSDNCEISPQLFRVTDNLELVTKVFQNVAIVEKVMKYVTNEPINNLSLRLVNKTFDRACLRMIRAEYKSVRLTKPRGLDEDNLRNCSQIEMNFKRLSAENIAKHVDFLKKVAEVKVTEIDMKRLWAMVDASLFRTVHEAVLSLITDENQSVIKQFTGIDDICRDGCSSCGLIAARSLEYGPLQMDVLHGFPEPRHFDTLHVHDYLLYKLAMECIESAGSKENIPMSPNVSCDRLVIHVSARPTYFPHDQQFGSNPLPREILDAILAKWAVQTVQLRIEDCFDYRKTTFAHKWTSHFSELRFDRSPTLIDESHRRFGSVEVEVKETRALPTFRIREERDVSYWHLASVVRKVFPSNRLRIVYECEKPAKQEIENMLKSALKDFPIDAKGSQLTIRVVSQTLRLRVSELFEGSRSSVVIHSKRWELSGVEVFEEKEDRLGIRFSMHDGKAKNSVKFEIFCDESIEILEDLEKLVAEQ